MKIQSIYLLHFLTGVNSWKSNNPNYPNCSVQSLPYWISEDSVGNGLCDVYVGLNTERCGWDGGDCCRSTCPQDVSLAEYVAFYYYYNLEGSACNFYWDNKTAEERMYDERHCADPNAEEYTVQETLSCDDYFELITDDSWSPFNGQCANYLYGLNSARCGWDGGDCCESTCVQGGADAYETTTDCGEFGYFCKDPNATDYGFEDEACVTHTDFQELYDAAYCHGEEWAADEWNQYNGLANLNTSACEYDSGKCLPGYEPPTSFNEAGPTSFVDILPTLCAFTMANLFID